MDTKLFMDADMAILGSDWEHYNEYAHQVRKEYAIYPDFIYKKGRKKVLHHFLEKKQLYNTSYFKEKYEVRAIHNIQREISEYL